MDFIGIFTINNLSGVLFLLLLIPLTLLDILAPFYIQKSVSFINYQTLYLIPIEINL